MKDRKGFTLIELLAVIIILGILMIIAIPSVTKYISSSRDESYITTVREYINATKNMVNSGKFHVYDSGTTYYVPTKCITMERGGDSPYGEFEKAYTIFTYNGENFSYYFGGYDTAGVGLNITGQDELSISRLRRDMHEFDDTAAVNGRLTVTKMDENTCNFGTATEAENSYGELNVIEGVDKYSFTYNYNLTLNDINNTDYYYKKLDGTYAVAGNLRSNLQYTFNSQVFYTNVEYNDSTGLRKADFYISPPTFVENSTGNVVKVEKVYFIHKEEYREKTGNIQYTYVCSANVPSGARFVKPGCVFNKDTYFGYTEYNSYNVFENSSIKIYFTLENGDTIDFRKYSYESGNNYTMDTGYSTKSLGNNNINCLFSFSGLQLD